MVKSAGALMTSDVDEVRVLLPLVPLMVSVEVPTGDAPPDPSMDFSIERLRQAGFDWTNPADHEIEKTLRMCQAAKDVYGDTLWKRCRPDLFPEAGR